MMVLSVFCLGGLQLCSSHQSVLQFWIFKMEHSSCPNRNYSCNFILIHFKSRNPVPLLSVSKRLNNMAMTVLKILHSDLKHVLWS